ncbi:hypothetical protein B0T18DRAFT_386888 [Schizothecium vesticola]|uniref:Uncharacterized protein n=1 Tax=Schizothecium vesticola TaxID=314040 RepID=A0AA40FCA0_9PEZI|nr:hypothetical protein B0T18DRAFT_386888 [Schizothecium vesticola]
MSALSRIPCGSCGLLSPAGGRRTGGHCRAQGAFEVVVARLARAYLMGMGQASSCRNPGEALNLKQRISKGGRRHRGSTLVARSHSITLDVEAHEIRPSSLDIGQVTSSGIRLTLARQTSVRTLKKQLEETVTSLSRSALAKSAAISPPDTVGVVVVSVRRLPLPRV